MTDKQRGQLLDDLRVASGHFAAASPLPVPQTALAFVAVTLDPAMAQLVVVSPDTDARAVIHADHPPDDLGRACAAFTSAGVASLNQSDRTRVAALLRSERATLGVVVAGVEGAAQLLLDHLGPDEPEVVCTLESADTETDAAVLH